MTRADLDYLINGIVNGLGGSGGFGRGYTGGGSSIGRGAVGRDISGADFDREENRHKKCILYFNDFAVADNFVVCIDISHDTAFVLCSCGIDGICNNVCGTCYDEYGTKDFAAI